MACVFRAFVACSLDSCLELKLVKTKKSQTAESLQSKRKKKLQMPVLEVNIGMAFEKWHQLRYLKELKNGTEILFIFPAEQARHFSSGMGG